MGFNIAIDGPAGAGKSTIAKMVAKQLDFIYVDTGAMYRAIGYFFLEKGIETLDGVDVQAYCEQIKVRIAYENGVQQIYLNDYNVTAYIREERVGNMASVVAANPHVREKLRDLQQMIAKEEDVVMDGRDIGTSILPEAPLKIYLTASVEVRADRRYKELTEKNVVCDINEIAADIAERDKRDMEREISPLMQAEDAVYLDSSDLTIEEVVGKIIELYEGVQK